MKKNVMMRIASVLLICVLVTTCGISGTFAKYVTTRTGSDEARVAKWGFGTTAIELELFATDYTDAVSSETDNIVAPGTGKEYTIVLIPAGQKAPEVTYSFDATITQTGDATLASQLVWYFNDEATELTFAELQTKISDYFRYAQIDANQLPTNKSVKIAWEWPFEDGNNSDDTTLGDNGTADITVTISFTATQINPNP